jgi:putative PIG3 family NAD(P)H quinone oxidoreductase
MNAIGIARPGGPDVLSPVRLPTPRPGAGEMLIRVQAAGINRPDAFQRQGLYDPPPGASPLLGLEAAGTVAALGEGVEGWSIGDAVCALLNGGGYAEYVAVPAGQALPAPKGLSPIEAAALPETVFTVWANLFERAGLKAGEAVLIHGGTSGIGTTAIQLARARGATVFATAGSADKARACEALGAAAGINYREQDFVAEVTARTGGRGVEVVLDMVGGDYLERNLAAAADQGRLVFIAHLQGRKAPLDIAMVMRKRLTLSGSTLRPRTTAEKAAIARAVKAEVWPLIEAGRVRPVIDSVFPLAEAAAAHARMEGGQHIGTIVLQVG